MTVNQLLMLLARQNLSEDAEILVNYPCAQGRAREQGVVDSAETDADGNIEIWVEAV